MFRKLLLLVFAFSFCGVAQAQELPPSEAVQPFDLSAEILANPELDWATFLEEVPELMAQTPTPVPLSPQETAAASAAASAMDSENSMPMSTILDGVECVLLQAELEKQERMLTELLIARLDAFDNVKGTETDIANQERSIDQLKREIVQLKLQDEFGNRAQIQQKAEQIQRHMDKIAELQVKLKEQIQILLILDDAVTFKMSRIMFLQMWLMLSCLPDNPVETPVPDPMFP